METITAMMFHNLFGRFPNVKVLIAEFGTPWLPYLVRKLDHAALLGRKPKYGTLPGRPSSIFKRNIVVAPFPEENVQRAIDAVGADGLVLGLDFPHSEGLPDPIQYASQLKGLDDVTVKKIMRDNLAGFLGLDFDRPAGRASGFGHRAARPPGVGGARHTAPAPAGLLRRAPGRATRRPGASPTGGLAQKGTGPTDEQRQSGRPGSARPPCPPNPARPAVEPRTLEHRTLELRAVERRTVEHRAVEHRAVELRAFEHGARPGGPGRPPRRRAPGRSPRCTTGTSPCSGWRPSCRTRAARCSRSRCPS